MKSPAERGDPTSFATDARVPSDAPLASIRRRMMAFTYEGVLMFGIVMFGAYVYGTLTQHRHALQGRTGLQVFLFVLMGIYFVWFWTHGGQSVAAKTWHLRLVDMHGRSVGVLRATIRYLLSWIWVAPALLASQLAGPLAPVASFALVFVGVVVYAALARLHPQRQFVHDAICGTRWIDTRAASNNKAAPVRS